MFDVLRKQKQIIYLFITGAMILGMGFFGMGSMMSKSTSRSGDTLVVIDGEPVTSLEVQERIESQMRRIRQMLGEQAEAILPQYRQELQSRAVEDLIEEKVSLSEARRLRLSVPDAELVQFIASQPYYQKDGKFDVDTYEKIPNRGEFEARLREDLLRNKFQQYLYERVRLTPAELKNSYAVKETKADVLYAKLNFNELGKKVPASPEKVKSALADMAALEAYYNAHKEAYTVPAKVELHQIRVGFPFQASPSQKEEAKKRIDAIAAKVTKENFVETARSSSDDEYAKKGGEVGWKDYDSFDEAIRKVVGNLDPGQVSPVIETAYAYYIVRVDQKKPKVEKTLEEVKSAVAEKVAQEKALAEWSEKKRQEWDKILSEGKSLEPELKKLSVEMKKTGPFSLGQGYVPNIGSVDPVLEAIFTLTPEKPVHAKLVAHEKDFYFLKLVTLERAKDADFTKNEQNFDKSLSSSIQMELAKAWIEQAKSKATIVSHTRTEKPKAN